MGGWDMMQDATGADQDNDMVDEVYIGDHIRHSEEMSDQRDLPHPLSDALRQE
jgi:hypothetical protein